MTSFKLDKAASDVLLFDMGEILFGKFNLTRYICCVIRFLTVTHLIIRYARFEAHSRKLWAFCVYRQAAAPAPQ